VDSRRDFLKKAALLSGAAVLGSVPESIQRAMAIAPPPGSTFWDAEHVVILMQENRSFDHSYGTLRGVRGFGDPRAHVLPNGNPVWLQTNAEGETYAPFRLNIKETNITWLGGLPHSWGDQVDARNNGRYDKWLLVKPAGSGPLAKKPMTLGHYTREDIPFYYALADAFTICDQHFCSSLTGTTPNRLYLWTGTIRPEQKPDSKPHVYNEEADHDHEVSWTTFPERLETAGVSWKVYQNELDIDSGLTDEEDAWLGNFGDNPLEYLTQFNVRLSPRRRAHVADRLAKLPLKIAALTGLANPSAEQAKRLAELKAEQSSLAAEQTASNRPLEPREKSLHDKAFDVNEGDPEYRNLETLTYDDDQTQRKMQAPKGDLFQQFRSDVEGGNLPAVSWLVGPEHFSDHPASAWFGAWYVSEALDILTKNPEVWKKTIFILTYDENDGYFDHVPPFVAPNPYREDGGKTSEDIDPKVEFVTREQDLKFRPDYEPRESSIGLGYRVPMVVASPWSRGGCVCSEVFDHTSVLQFLERFLSKKSGKKIEESNISSWRRAVCGDLTSIFQTNERLPGQDLKFLDRDETVEAIHRAQFKSPPTGFVSLTSEEVEAARSNPQLATSRTRQESGTRPSCPLPYELHVDGRLSDDRSRLEVEFSAGPRSAGSPFNAYAYLGSGGFQARAYAVSPGKKVTDVWNLSDFEKGAYHVRVDGPNGFMREFRGAASSPNVEVGVEYAARGRRPYGDVVLRLENQGKQPVAVSLADGAYGQETVRVELPARAFRCINWKSSSNHGWYDILVGVEGDTSYVRRFAGRVETGEWSISDPAIGNASR
jgi:phospholipase C